MSNTANSPSKRYIFFYWRIGSIHHYRREAIPYASNCCIKTSSMVKMNSHWYTCFFCHITRCKGNMFQGSEVFKSRPELYDYRYSFSFCCLNNTCCTFNINGIDCCNTILMFHCMVQDISHFFFWHSIAFLSHIFRAYA